MRGRLFLTVAFLTMTNAACTHSIVPRSATMPPLRTGVVQGAVVKTAGAWSVRDGAVPAAPASEAMSLSQAAVEAVSPDAERSAAAIAVLRAAGYAGLDALVSANAGLLEAKLSSAGNGLLRVTRGSETPASILAWERLTAALDAVAMQKDAYASRLFWYTDLEAAKAAAVRENKPILSLRLLGKLNEELSCANSRFFRTTLYPNAQVSAYLREHFILHWQSVRPVPVVTIDMGDGRTMMRTITGNSIHYVLDARGRAVDGIPGLYGAKAFIAALEAAREPAAAAGALDDLAFRRAVGQFAAGQRERIGAAWAADLGRIDPNGALGVADAAQLSDEAWAKMAALHADEAPLDSRAAVVVRSKIPMEVAMRLTVSKMASESPLVKLFRNVQDSIALDTVKNEYTMHARIDTMIAAAQPLGRLNDRVYAEVFLTPNDDPWLGLAAPDAFAAIDNGGIVSLNAASR